MWGFRWIRNLSLRWSLALSVIAPLLVAMGLASYVTLQAFERESIGQMEEDAELVARALRLPLEEALEEGQLDEINEILESAFDDFRRVYSAQVYDATGEPIVAIPGLQPVPRMDRLADLAERGDQEGEFEEIGGRASFFVPLVDSGGRVIGLLQVTRRVGDIQETVSTLRWQAGGFLAIAMILVAGLVLYGHHRAIGKHLSRLSRSMERVEAGDLEHRATQEGPKEIASLASALNTMLESIGQARAEIEERREKQLKLEKRLRHAEKLAAIGQLSAGVAHELGTPLSVIDGQAQRALRKEVPDDVESTLDSIRDEVERMEHIIRQLLDFGRRHTIEARPVEMDQIARMAIGGCQERAAANGVSLEVEGNSPAPVVEVDPTLMERALANLVENGIEAAPSGHVRLTWFEGEEEAGFIVEDDGPGIDEEHEVRLFEPFFTTKSVGEGTGLGLAVVHGIVEEHDGRVEVGTSDLGGAQFSIVLPIENRTHDTPPAHHDGDEHFDAERSRAHRGG